ncbi:MAG: hypothetical protein HFG48_00715 [Bacilli bacterium]|nr:hypothetical protein [Bacilli bacterium]
MKNLKKGLLFSSLVTLAFSLNVTALTGYGFSVGTNYGDSSKSKGSGSSVEEAIAARDYLNAMGYSTTLVTVPTMAELTFNSNAGRPRLESDVLYFSGHADPVTIQWNYLKKGGSYAVGIESRNQNATWGGYSFVGLGQYKLSNIKLVVFMGCNTAAVPENMGNRTNITVYTKSLGARTTIGWDKEIAQLDTLKWTRRFFSALQAGFNVQDAANFANNDLYSNSNIKSNYVMGVGTATLNSSATVMRKISNSYSAKFDVTSDSVKDNIAKYIVDNINFTFNEDDFLIETVKNSNGIVYDYYFSPCGIKTILGYTVVIDNNSNISVVDNTAGMNLEEIRDIINKKLLTSVKYSCLNNDSAVDLNLFLNDVNEGYRRNITDKELVYDVLDDKLYMRYLVEEADIISNARMIIEKRIEM